MHAFQLIRAAALAAGIVTTLAAVQDGERRPPSRIERLEKRLLASPEDVGLLRQLGRAYFYAARRGDPEGPAKSIAAFERVRELAPDKDIHYDLGTAYMTRLAYLTAAREPLAAQTEMVERAVAEYSAGLSKHPDDSALNAGLGMARTIRAFMTRKREDVVKGIALLDRGVELDPDGAHPRLARGFTLMGLPPAAKQTDKVIDDLQRLVARVDAGRDAEVAGVLRVFLGDVLAGAGEVDRARRVYEATRGLESTAKGEAEARLAALDKGQVDRAAARRYRGNALHCAACHAPRAELAGNAKPTPKRDARGKNR